jgi:putative ABC transport system permease protein
VYLPADTATPGTVLIARVRGDVEKARQSLEERLFAVDPEMEQVGALGWVTVMETYFLQVAFWSTVALGALALALTLSGLFSVLSYVVERRAREIGVRMALGATTRDVTRLVLWQSARPVAIGLAMGAGSAFALSAVLLSTPADAPIGQIVRLMDPIAYFSSLAIIVLACLLAASIPAGRAAALDPMHTLRRE